MEGWGFNRGGEEWRISVCVWHICGTRRRLTSFFSATSSPSLISAAIILSLSPGCRVWAGGVEGPGRRAGCWISILSMCVCARERGMYNACVSTLFCTFGFVSFLFRRDCVHS